MKIADGISVKDIRYTNVKDGQPFVLDFSIAG